jgi:hypothetical protein
VIIRSARRSRNRHISKVISHSCGRKTAERTAVAALWTLVSPRAAFRYLVVSTGIAVAALLATARSHLG